MEVRPGYKKTEIGIIPEDWDVKRLGQVLDVIMGQSPHSKNYNKRNCGLPLIQGNADIEGHKTIAKVYTTQLTKKCNKGDVVMTVRAPVGEVSIASTDSCLGRGVCSFNVRDIISNYLYFLLVHLRNEWESIGQGSTFTAANSNQIKDLKILLPDKKEEQWAVVELLCDIDSLISSLEKLIAKKKLIKQGLMQDLLTGKRRLPGFNGEWVTKRLGEIAGRITTGKLDANAMKENGEYRFYTCAKEFYYIDIYAFEGEALLVSGNGAYVGYVHYYDGRFNAYQRTYVIMDISEDIFFVKLFMDVNLKERIETEVNLGNTPYIKMDTLTEMEIRLPSTKQEQNAIAQVNRDIDSEISILCQQLSKYNLLKQGMMEELLTGRIRLV